METNQSRFALALDQSSLTQADVARKIGVKRQTVNEWIRGVRPIPATRRGQLSVLLDVPVDELKEA